MITVKCFSDLPDLELNLEAGAANAELIDQIRSRWPTTAGKRVRLVFDGKELEPSASLPPQPCVVHCVVTEAIPIQASQQQPRQQQQDITVKFVDGSRDLVIGLPLGSLVSALFLQIREQRSIPSEQRLRAVYNGTELQPHVHLPQQQPCIVHCTATSAPAPIRVPPPPDWVDTIGARTVLKAVVGGTLLIADHHVFVSHSGNASVALLLLLVAFNALFIVSCFPQLLVRSTFTPRQLLHFVVLDCLIISIVATIQDSRLCVDAGVVLNVSFWRRLTILSAEVCCSEGCVPI